MTETPVLWHIRFSHFNEKARWALDWKGIAHERRAVLPGKHVGVAKRLAGTQTLPILKIGDLVIADSAEIIAELERRQPEPPLYPADPDLRARALALEQHFGAELGPAIRRAAFGHLLRDRATAVPAITEGFGLGARLAYGAAFPALRRRVAQGLGVDEQGVRSGWEQTRAALDRVQAELGPSGYLVGDSFSVADLTAAALLSAGVGPPEFPYPQAATWLEEFEQRLGDHPTCAWVREIYARHRGVSAEVA